MAESIKPEAPLPEQRPNKSTLSEKAIKA